MDKYSIRIDNLRDIIIKKVKHGYVRFKHKDKMYVLDVGYSLDNQSEETTFLSEVELDTITGQYKEKRCLNAIRGNYVKDLIHDISKRGHTLNYCNIDKIYFCKVLTSIGFMDGIFKETFDRFNDKISQYNKQIEYIQSKIKAEQAKYFKKEMHTGSRYRPELKEQMANKRAVFHQAGEYCKKYNAPYGSIHPEYGGVLTDLRSLPVGKIVFITNGFYSAAIVADRHGDKAVETDRTLVKLTEENHAAYIETDHI